jgi:hypothetical protein
MWLDPGSNRGHADFQSAALPAELSSQVELISEENDEAPILFAENIEGASCWSRPEWQADS